MSKPVIDDQVTLHHAKLDRKSRLSLPETESHSASVKQRRNTVSDINNGRVKKKVKAPTTPTIIEDEDDQPKQTFNTLVIANERKTAKVNRNSSNASRISSGSRASRSTAGYDNTAYEGGPSKFGGENSSIHSPSKAPSIQSYEIYREQYCCFSKRTKCERSLLITVMVLSIIIIVLVIVIIVLAKHIHDPTSSQFISNI